MKKVLYFDCFAGISGDMTLGALIDLGADKDKFLEEMNKLNVEGFEIKIGTAVKNGISATEMLYLLMVSLMTMNTITIMTTNITMLMNIITTMTTTMTTNTIMTMNIITAMSIIMPMFTETFMMFQK